MPSNWTLIDNNFPTFTGKETPQQQIAALHNYMYQLREGLQYSLQNLTAENFNAAALQNLSETQKNEVASQLQQVYNLMNQLSAELNSLSGRVAGIEGLSGRVTTAETEISFLDKRVGSAEENIENLQERAAEAEADLADHEVRLGAAEEGIQELKQSVEDLAALEDEVTGEGGLSERVASAEGEVKKLSETVHVAEDGSATVGSQGRALHLVGDIYINGVLYGGGSE